MAAWTALTPLPGRRIELLSPRFGRIAPLFPLVGATVGMALLGANALIATRLPAIAGAAVVAVLWEVSTRGHLRREASLAAPSVAAVVVAKWLALAWLEPRLLGLLFAPVLGAWSIVVLAVGARDADRPGRKLAPAVLFNEFAVASLLALALVFSLAEGIGILIGVSAAAISVGIRVAAHQWIGGMSARWLIVGSQLSELTTLFILLAVQR